MISMKYNISFVFQGDSGGPYTVGGILLGITSWGYECAAAGHPGVFSSIPVLRTFVDEILNRQQ